ncbi:MAG TPA: hypothetical protein VNH44_05580 [Micropepsaceae bacterium]|nr:hypothetical protein [Micropepsaceae bacterium]
MRPRVLLMAAFCLALAGCQSFKPIEAMKAVDVGDGITVEPQVEWAFAVGPLNGGMSGTVWTIDGFGLNELRFLTGVAGGAPLLRIDGIDRKDMVAYNTTMLPDDVMEMVAGTLGKAGNQQLRTAALRPVPFGTGTGFRFDLSYTTKDGLQMKGTALFAQRKNKLDVILFAAPSEYYYDRYVPTVEKVFASVRVADAPGAKPSS